MKKLLADVLLPPFALLCLLAAASCTKTGPQGPAGPAGAAGVDGNANIWVDTLTIHDAQWGFGGEADYSDSMYSSGTSSKNFTLELPQITQGILDSGAVSVSFDPNTYVPHLTQPVVWQPLPFEYTEIGTYSPLIWDYKVSLGEVIIYLYYVSVPTGRPSIDNYNPGDHEFKIVVEAGHL